MADYTKYPQALDDTTSLPLTINNHTPVEAEVANRLREAIMAIEAELGVNPSGTYGTVKAWLEALQLQINLGSGGGGGAISIADEGSTIVGAATSLNFVGTGVTITDAGGGVGTVAIPGLEVLASSVSLEENALSIDFSGTGITTTTDSNGNISVDVPGLEVLNESVSLEENALSIDFSGPGVEADTDGYGNISVIVTGPIDFSRIRVYADTQSGSVSPAKTTVAWANISTKVNDLEATKTITELVPSRSGNFNIRGQITFEVTADPVTGYVAEVYNTGILLETITARGLVLGIGIRHSISWSFPCDLLANDHVYVRFYHIGPPSGSVNVVGGDDASWFAIEETVPV